MFVLCGFFLGEAWPVIEQYTDILQYVVIAAAIAAVVWFVLARVRGSGRSAEPRRYSAE